MEDTARVQVLIVDDDPEHAEIYRELIQGPDLDVVVTGNGQAALQLLRLRPFRIVLTDLIMPGMNGMELMRRILLEHPAMIVIMITGSGDLRGAVRAMQQGAFSYFSKAGDADDLRLEIRKALEIITLRAETAWKVPAPVTILPPFERSAADTSVPSLKQARCIAEKIHIQNVLRQVHGNKTHAANVLGISYRQLLNRMKTLDL